MPTLYGWVVIVGSVIGNLAILPYYALTGHGDAQQTLDVQPMLAQCWASVRDAGSTLHHH